MRLPFRARPAATRRPSPSPPAWPPSPRRSPGPRRPPGPRPPPSPRGRAGHALVPGRGRGRLRQPGRQPRARRAGPAPAHRRPPTGRRAPALRPAAPRGPEGHRRRAARLPARDLAPRLRGPRAPRAGGALGRACGAGAGRGSTCAGSSPGAGPLRLTLATRSRRGLAIASREVRRRRPRLVVTSTARAKPPAKPPATPPPPPPPRRPAGAVRVAAVGDIHPPSASSKSAATAAEAAKADLILGLGDYQYQSGTMADFNAYFDKDWGPLVRKMYPVLGADARPGLARRRPAALLQRRGCARLPLPRHPQAADAVLLRPRGVALRRAARRVRAGAAGATWPRSPRG